MLKKIEIPEGKTLLSTVGRFQFDGPMLLIHRRGLRLESTFTDGTPWIYYDAAKSRDALANTKKIEEAAKKEAKKAVAKKKREEKKKRDLKKKQELENKSE